MTSERETTQRPAGAGAASGAAAQSGPDLGRNRGGVADHLPGESSGGAAPGAWLDPAAGGRAVDVPVAGGSQDLQELLLLVAVAKPDRARALAGDPRSEEHTSEL